MSTAELFIPDARVRPDPDEGAYPCSLCAPLDHRRVTQILDATIPKYALVPWAFKMGKEGKDIEAEKEAGGRRGGELHDYLEAYATTGNVAPLSDLSPECRPYGQQLAKMLLDYEPEFHASEFYVAHHVLDYAGRCDGIATIHKQPTRRNKPWNLAGKTVIFDLKTNRDGRVYKPAMYLQVAAYRLAWDHMGGQPLDHEVIVAIGEDKYQVAVNYFELESFTAVAACHQVLREQEEHNPNRRGK